MMEKDTNIKEILLNSAEGASPDFTDSVMKRINNPGGVLFHYQPLVSHKVQRIFLITSGVLIVSIFVLCLLIAVSHMPVLRRLQNMEIPDLNFKVLTFVIVFWMVFFMNKLFERNFLANTKYYSQKH